MYNSDATVSGMEPVGQTHCYGRNYMAQLPEGILISKQHYQLPLTKNAHKTTRNAFY